MGFNSRLSADIEFSLCYMGTKKASALQTVYISAGAFGEWILKRHFLFFSIKLKVNTAAGNMNVAITAWISCQTIHFKSVFHQDCCFSVCLIKVIGFSSDGKWKEKTKELFPIKNGKTDKDGCSFSSRHFLPGLKACIPVSIFHETPWPSCVNMSRYNTQLQS